VDGCVWAEIIFYYFTNKVSYILHDLSVHYLGRHLLRRHVAKSQQEIDPMYAVIFGAIFRENSFMHRAYRNKSHQNAGFITAAARDCKYYHIVLGLFLRGTDDH